MKTRKSFAVLVRKRDTDKLLRTLSSSVIAFKISARPHVVASSMTLESISYDLEGEERQVEAFRELVQASPLRYKPKSNN